jgi:hypothetical protein
MFCARVCFEQGGEYRSIGQRFFTQLLLANFHHYLLEGRGAKNLTYMAFRVI